MISLPWFMGDFSFNEYIAAMETYKKAGSVLPNNERLTYEIAKELVKLEDSSVLPDNC